MRPPFPGQQRLRSVGLCALARELASPDFSPDRAAAAGYASIWTPSLRLQRDFQVYGGEFLMAQPVESLRGFFSAFFKLETILWGGFLAGWPGLPGNEFHDSWEKRLGFGVNLDVDLDQGRCRQPRVVRG